MEDRWELIKGFFGVDYAYRGGGFTCVSIILSIKISRIGKSGYVFLVIYYLN